MNLSDSADKKDEKPGSGTYEEATRAEEESPNVLILDFSYLHTLSGMVKVIATVCCLLILDNLLIIRKTFCGKQQR